MVNGYRTWLATSGVVQTQLMSIVQTFTHRASCATRISVEQIFPQEGYTMGVAKQGSNRCSEEVGKSRWVVPIPAGTFACSECSVCNGPLLVLGVRKGCQWFPLPNISSPASPAFPRRPRRRVDWDVRDHRQTELVHVSLPQRN